MNAIVIRSIASIFLFLAVATTARAAGVQISELMYDVSGADSGREWVEAYNAGGNSVDLGASDFRFFNKEGGHKIVSYNGASTVLPPGGVAVIADNPANFLADNPGFSGTVLDSSFSLVAADTIGFKLADGTIIDSIAYDSSMGAAGDGNSLSRSGSTLVPGAPTPGSVSGSAPVQAYAAADTTTDTATTTVAQNTTSSAGPPALSVSVMADAVPGIAGAGSFFTAQALGIAGAPVSNAHFSWSFGDGGMGEGERVVHTYAYPGEYVVSVAAGSGYSSGNARLTVVVVDAEIFLVAERDGSATVYNRSTQLLDIGNWTIKTAQASFLIPPQTYVLAGRGVRFSPAVTGVSADRTAQLVYPNGALAATAALTKDSPLHGEPVAAQPVSTRLPVPSEEPLSVRDSEPAAALAAAAASTSTLPLEVQEKEGQSLLFWSLVGLVAVLLAGVAVVWRAEAPRPAEPETLPRAEEFDIE